MKRFLPILAFCALLLPALQPARGADASINLFYDNLNGGNWYEVSDYGYVWQPDVATNPNWRPYTDGYWAYTDQGWTWVSYEDFGWATYHYGRWARLADYGWVWVPGTEWAPAWVSWRTGGDYVGWAPLPPAGGGEVVYESRPITGHVDLEFGIGPAYYNFVDLRYIGEPVLRDRIVDYNQNVTIINNTVNVTNITYNNSMVYSYGPDYARLSAYSVRPIQRLKLERQTNVDALQAVRSGNVTKVQGNQLLVAAPMKLEKAPAQVAPKQVKAKIEQPKVEKGWSNITDPGEKAKIEQKMKTESAKNVPKPNIQPANPKAGNVNANQAPAKEAAASPRPGKGNRRGEMQETAPATGAAAVTNPAEPRERGKDKNRPQRAEGPAATPGAEAARNEPANARAEEPAAKRNKSNKHEPNVAPGNAGAAGNAAVNEGNEVKPTPANRNNKKPQAAENEQQRVRQNEAAAHNEERARQNQETARRNEEQKGQAQRREQQERLQGNSNVARPNQPQAGPTGHNRAEPERKQPEQQPQAGGKEKAKGKKPEGQQSPSPQ